MNTNFKNVTDWLCSNPDKWDQKHWVLSHDGVDAELNKKEQTADSVCSFCLASAAALLSDEVDFIEPVGVLSGENLEPRSTAEWASDHLGVNVGAFFAPYYPEELLQEFEIADEEKTPENIRGFFDSLWETYGYE